MLIRILADNPGPTFTRNLDDKFVKDVLKTPDPSVHQMMMETLDTFEATKGYDEGLAPLISMWKHEKKDAQKRHGGVCIISPCGRKEKSQDSGNG